MSFSSPNKTEGIQLEILYIHPFAFSHQILGNLVRTETVLKQQIVNLLQSFLCSCSFWIAIIQNNTSSNSVKTMVLIEWTEVPIIFIKGKKLCMQWMHRSIGHDCSFFLMAHSYEWESCMTLDHYIMWIWCWLDGAQLKNAQILRFATGWNNCCKHCSTNDFLTSCNLINSAFHVGLLNWDKLHEIKTLDPLLNVSVDRPLRNMVSITQASYSSIPMRSFL